MALSSVERRQRYLLKHKQINTTVTELDYMVISRAARSRGLSVSAFVRIAAYGLALDDLSRLGPLDVDPADDREQPELPY